PRPVRCRLRGRIGPLVPMMRVWGQVKGGEPPERVAAFQLLPPLVVYPQPVKALSLSVRLVVRSKGLSTKPPNWVLEGVTGPAVGGVCSRNTTPTYAVPPPDVVP